jgi:hypothetical protein
MALDVRKFGPKSDKIGAHRGAFVYQEPFKKDSSTASRVINEVVLGCEYPGEWLWATPRTGLTLLLGEPKVPRK